MLKHLMLLPHYVLSHLSKNFMDAASISNDIFEGNSGKDTTSDCRLSRLSRYVFPSKMLPYQLAQIQTLVLFISRCTLVLPWSTMNNRRHWQMFTGHGIDDNREFAQWWRSAFNLLDHLAGRKNYSKLKLEFKAVYSGSV